MPERIPPVAKNLTGLDTEGLNANEVAEILPDAIRNAGFSSPEALAVAEVAIKSKKPKGLRSRRQEGEVADPAFALYKMMHGE